MKARIDAPVWRPLPTMLTIIALLALLAFLSGCDATKAGMTKVELTFNEAGDLTGVNWWDGKEKSNVELSADLKQKIIQYQAKNVLAFEGQRIRADVDKRLAEMGETVAPAVVDAIIKAVIGVP